MFHGWDNYYFMLGSAAAGLIGLLFVVVTLTAGYERSQALRGNSLYMTPTMVCFALVLTTSAVAIAPGLSDQAMAAVIGVISLVGLGVALRASVGLRTPISELEPPHWSDIWFYGTAPMAIHLGIITACVAICGRLGWATYALAALLLALLLIAIRNAWDLVTYLAPKREVGAIASTTDPAS